jgi:predicted nucleotidyltransferase
MPMKESAKGHITQELNHPSQPEPSVMKRGRLKNAYKAIDEFCQRLVSKDGNKIEAIMVYGSIINGRYRAKRSDIDIMVISRDKNIDEDILNLETNISLKYGVVISALLTTAKELQEGKKAGYAFFDEVLKGRKIYERRNTRDKTGS